MTDGEFEMTIQLTDSEMEKLLDIVYGGRDKREAIKIAQDALDRVLEERRKKPKTNAERIRSMTDEELRDLIDELEECHCHDFCIYDGNTCNLTGCKKGILRWLKSEAEE